MALSRLGYKWDCGFPSYFPSSSFTGSLLEASHHIVSCSVERMTWPSLRRTPANSQWGTGALSPATYRELNPTRVPWVSLEKSQRICLCKLSLVIDKTDLKPEIYPYSLFFEKNMDYAQGAGFSSSSHLLPSDEIEPRERAHICCRVRESESGEQNGTLGHTQVDTSQESQTAWSDSSF